MKINKKIIFSLFIILLMIFGTNYKVEASYSAASQTVDSGANVSITIKSTEKLENFDLECTDVGGLTYKSCSSSVTGAVVNSAGKKISYALIGGEATTLGVYNFTAPEVKEKTTYTVKFDVNGEIISSTITVKPKETTPPPANNDDKNNITNTDKNTTTNNNVTDKNNVTNNNSSTNSGTTDTKPKEKSKNAYLRTLGVRIKADLAKELGVETNEYDFSGFSKKKTSYNVTVPYDVDYLKVEYKTDDANASVKVTGNSGFEVGSKNKITIKVTAEDGKATQTYTIKVTKLAKEEEKPGNVIEKEDEGLYLTSLELDGIQLLPAFVKDTYSYTATLDNATNKDIEVNAKANKENANIEITGNTNLASGENTINIVLTMPDSTVQTVYQVVLTANFIKPTIDDEIDISTTTDFMGAITKYVGIAIAVVVLIIVLVIVLIILLRRESERLSQEDEEDLEETKAEEYNVYENDENEFIKKDTEENEERYVEYISNKTETKNVRRRSRREKGKHSK